MIRQYTRLIVDKSDNSITHATSQDFPFAEGWEPVGFDPATHEAVDFEIDVDFPDQDHGIGRDQKLIRARQIKDNFEVGGAGRTPRLKATAVTAVAFKVLKVSRRKDITQNLIRPEMVAAILAAIDPQTEKEFLDDLRAANPKTPKTLADFSMLALKRLHGVLGLRS